MARPAKVFDVNKVIEAATMYYERDCSMKEIAAQLLGNAKNFRGVNSLLDQARASGILEIRVNQQTKGGLDTQIIRRFPHLRRVLIAPGPSGGKGIDSTTLYDKLLQQWGSFAADYFEEFYRDAPAGKRINVAVTGSEHVGAFVNALKQYRRDNVYVYVPALIGRARLAKNASHTDPIVNASILWSRCGSLPGHIEYATVSPYVSKRAGPRTRVEVVDREIALVEENSAVRDVLDSMRNIDIVFGGIGVTRPEEIEAIPRSLRSRMTMTALLDGLVKPAQLAKEEAAGDYCYSIFDREGRGRYHPGNDGWRFFLSAGHNTEYAGIEFYKHMVETGKRVVAFAGPFKLRPIVTALKAKIINVLITDEHTAQRLADGASE